MAGFYPAIFWFGILKHEREPVSDREGWRTQFYSLMEEELHMMRYLTRKAVLITAILLIAFQVSNQAIAENYPKPLEHDYTIRNFRFHDGNTMDLKMHYLTIGNPDGEPVLILHGTNGSARKTLNNGFAEAVFGPGQPLDAQKYFLILPDSIGAGGSQKPSGGLRMKFPHYNYDDMVEAQYRLVKEGPGLDHLRLILGHSMGGIHVSNWSIRYPDFADALVPMASLPAPMAGRNWMMRRTLIDAITTDPAWQSGNYEKQPENLRIASVWYDLATNGGNTRLWQAAPTNAEANTYVDVRLAEAKIADANDTLYQWSASQDFDPSKDLEKITAHLFAINAADDERNREEPGHLQSAVDRMPHGRYLIIPAGSKTRGHATTSNVAELYAEELGAFLSEVPAK
jgi:homoserine O-acetyltransferase